MDEFTINTCIKQIQLNKIKRIRMNTVILLSEVQITIEVLCNLVIL